MSVSRSLHAYRMDRIWLKAPNAVKRVLSAYAWQLTVDHIAQLYLKYQPYTTAQSDKPVAIDNCQRMSTPLCDRRYIISHLQKIRTARICLTSAKDFWTCYNLPLFVDSKRNSVNESQSPSGRAAQKKCLFKLGPLEQTCCFPALFSAIAQEGRGWLEDRDRLHTPGFSQLCRTF